MKPEPKDRRSRRTQRLLGGALLELLQEGTTFQSLTVGAILRRADVGRTTFYAHYSGKEDLLLSEVLEQLLAAPGLSPQGSAPDCVGLFRQIRDQMQVLRVILGAQGSPLLLGHFQTLLSGLFEDGLRQGSPLSGVPLPLQGRFVAQTFVLVLTWWIEQRLEPTPEEVERLFLGMVAPTYR